MRSLFALLLFLLGQFTYAQNDLLAKNYFDQGEYQKALAIYKKLVDQNPNDTRNTLNLIKTQQQLERFEEAETILKDRLNARSVFPQYYIELGYNYALQQKDSLAELSYRKAIDMIQIKPQYAYSLGQVFSEYSLLEEAVEVYETAMERDPGRDYSPQLARIYGEQGKLEKMFETYLNLLKINPTYTYTIRRNLNDFVTEDPTSEGNQLLRKALLRKLQQDPDVIYNELLSWLFIQQKEYKKAFIQEKAIFARTEENLNGLMDLARIATEEKSYPEAKEIVLFIIDKANSPFTQMEGYQQLLFIELQIATPATYSKIDQQFQDLLQEYGEGADTYLLQIDYYDFLAFRYGKKETAIEKLKWLAKGNLNDYQEARVKMKLADILVFDERFNEALIYYSQIQNKVKSDILAQEARFKVAQTSYFKGDFEWAQTQLDVLKKSTSQLIANDAMQLSLMIRDNSLEDTTQTALKKFAHADLKALQHKDAEAIVLLNDILTNHKGEKIEDEALLKAAQLYERLQQYEQAEAYYLKLIELYNEDILADDAHYRLAQLYENQLNLPQKAKQEYEQILFNFEDSIYFVEARKRFRMLRGDEIN
jgi:tetratricopeptide (TPR) repeat protein